jgi:imidazolonepropionase-like amidohydrolase
VRPLNWLGFGLVLDLLAPGDAIGQPARSTAITNVTVIDLRSGRSTGGQTVVVDGRRIAAVGASGTIRPPAGSLVVDGRGKFLIPGLWDMHVHTSIPGGEALLGLYPVFGVTGVRDMNDSFPQVADWRRRIARGQLAGPRIVAAGPYLSGGAPPLPHFQIRTAEDGRAAVDSLRRLGVDFVKVHNGIPREGYLAAAARVKELGWTFAGHVPQAITVAEAADAGQRSMEHLTGFPNRCTAEESASIRPTGLLTFILGACADTDLAPVFERLRANGTWVTPTLTVFGSISGDSTTPVDSMARYRSEALRQLQGVVMRVPAMTAEARAAARFLIAKRQSLVGDLLRAGVAILAGSDAPTPGTFPGVSLHEELDLLVAAGMSPLAALRSATIEPARYLGALDSLGTVATGKLADLVLLDGDPTADIRNARRIAAVWVDGRMIDRVERGRILAAAEAAAKDPR